MRTGTYTLTVLLALGLLAAGGLFGGALDVTQTASAYCDPVWTELTGQCENSCTVTSDIYYKLTGENPPWYCPM